MTKEELRAIVGEDMPAKTLTALLDAMHGEIGDHKSRAETAAQEAEQAKTSLADTMKQLEALQGKAGSAEELQKQLESLQAQYERDTKAAAEKLSTVEFDAMLGDVIRGAGARNIKAARALLDIDALRASKNQRTDAEAALTALKEAEDSAFLFAEPEPKPTGLKVNIGGKTEGEPLSVDTFEAAARKGAGLDTETEKG